MKKRILAFLMVAVLVMASLTACGGSKENTDSTTTTEEGATTEDSTATEETTKTVRIGMVTDVGGVNDGSFNQSSWEGLQRAAADLGIEVNYLQSESDADYAPNIETFVEEEYDLIISVGYMLADATRAAATAYPEQKFAIIDDATCADLPNVTCLMFEQAQASYLVGLVAGQMTESNTVGFVLGMSTEVMNQFGYGYLAGVLDANPEAKIEQINANAFGDTAGGKSAAITMVANGADVIFHAAGGTGLGVIEGCAESGIWAIGVDSDQSSIAPETIITSAMKRVDNACYDIAKACLEGTIEAGVKTYDLSTAGVDIAPTTTNLPEEVVTAVEEAKAKVISGEIVVPRTQADFEAKYGDVYQLD